MFNTVAINKRGLTVTLTLTIILLTFMFTLVSASAVNLDYFGWDLDSDGTDEYSITLKEVGTYVTSPATGYRWTYEVYAASTFSGNSTNLRAISHWILAFCGGKEGVILASNYMSFISYGKDPSGTGIWGIKFDTSFPTGATTEVWFILDADYPQAEVPVAIKPGQLNFRS